MNWKQLLYKIFKGALGGAASALAGIQIANLFGARVDAKHAVMAAGASIVGAAFHGAANVIEQIATQPPEKLSP